MTRPRILIIDDDAQLVQLAREVLLKTGFLVDSIASFKDSRFLKDVNAPHLIVLDLLTPGFDGVESVKALRKESPVPIIITTMKGDVSDRIGGLEAGADDYLVKPFDARELTARINTVLRRSPLRELGSAEIELREWRFKGLVVQSARRRIVLDNEQVELTTAEFDLLRLLVSSGQQTLSREHILDQMRGIEWETVDRSVDILISRLREKLRDDPRKPRFIRTIRSVGYQFIAEPDQVDSASGIC